LSISLGQGQGEKASRFIDQAMEDGSWVVLQNCHLAESWMPAMEQKVLSFPDKKDTMHQDFRLFLTSMPASYFPVAVLQNSLKLTTEPPRGLKANMTRCYDNYTQAYLDECTAKDKLAVWRKMLFNFAFFHACI
jgi:dynein heavy chain